MSDPSSTPSVFTPANVVDVSKERDWPAQLGMLDWDSTHILFTKRSLLEFLKYTGTTVDPNFTNIQKLPRYAKFGKLSAGDGAVATASATASSPDPSVATDAPADTDAASVPPSSDFKPTRRVRDPPGGRQHNIFAFGGDDDALGQAPPKASESTSDDIGEAVPTTDEPKRQRTGVAGLWDAPDVDPQFKPTRRVRERPGGKDSISELF